MNLLTNLSLSLFGCVCLTVFGFANETNVASSKPMGKATNSIRLEYWQRKAQNGEVVVRYKGTSPTDFAIALNKSRPGMEVSLEHGIWEVKSGEETSTRVLQVKGALGETKPIKYDIQLRFPIAAEKQLFDESYAIIQQAKSTSEWKLERHFLITNETGVDLRPFLENQVVDFQAVLIEDFEGGRGVVAEFNIPENTFKAQEVRLLRQLVKAKVDDRIVIDPFANRFQSADRVFLVFNGKSSGEGNVENEIVQEILAGKPIRIFNSQLHAIQPVIYSVKKDVPAVDYLDGESPWISENKKGTFVLDFEESNVDVSKIQPAKRSFEPWVALKIEAKGISYLQARSGDFGDAECKDRSSGISLRLLQKNGVLPYPSTLECKTTNPALFHLVDSRELELEFPENYREFVAFQSTLGKLKTSHRRICAEETDLKQFLESIELTSASCSKTADPFAPIDEALAPFTVAFASLQELESQREGIELKLKQIETQREELRNERYTDRRRELIRLERSEDPLRRQLRQLNNAIDDEVYAFDVALSSRSTASP